MVEAAIYSAQAGPTVLATDLKKVLEERILNGKVEFTLGEILGIAKREFHEVIIDIIKRKHQALSKLAASFGLEVIKEDEGVEEEVEKMEAKCHQMKKVRFVEDID
ncbi:unnamed protein product [Calypogeia fissa]